MKKSKIQDERVNMIRGKISSEALTVVMITLFIMAVVQLNAPFKQVMGELVTIIVLGLYLLIRSLMTGLNFFGENTNHHFKITSSSLVGLAVMVISGINNYLHYGRFYQNDKSFVFIVVLGMLFVSGFLLTYTVLSFVAYTNNKRQQNIQKKLDDEEDKLD